MDCKRHVNPSRIIDGTVSMTTRALLCGAAMTTACTCMGTIEIQWNMLVVEIGDDLADNRLISPNTSTRENERGKGEGIELISWGPFCNILYTYSIIQDGFK